MADDNTTVAALVPDAHNRRKHNARNLEMIVAALHDVGAARSIVIDEGNEVLAGNGVLEAAGRAGISKVQIVDADGDTIVAVRRSGLTAAQKRSLAIYDNRTAELAEWSMEQLAADLKSGEDMAPFFTQEELDKLLSVPGLKRGRTDPDDIPAARPTSIVVGDQFELGDHRLVCGDTTDAVVVGKLAAGASCSLLHADPPYGMGKEADGIMNDNLTGAHLDAFQMRWLAAWRPVWNENGSAYIWGNAPELWRLWWRGGLEAPDLMVRNEIVWDKGNAFGMASDLGHSFSPATERCLFLMRGQQFLGSLNTADYFEGYEPLRLWLVAERDRAGWKNSDVNRITKTNMAGHWFTKAQFTPISSRQYAVLAEAAGGRAFTERYDTVFERVFGAAAGSGDPFRRELSERLRESRTYFDNAHDAMTDVWKFARVLGEERFGHATPKPVAMVARALQTSSAPGDVVGVPFAGTGPELIAAEQLGSRRVIAAELEPLYCQIVIERWQAFTGQKAVKVGDARV